MLWKSSLFNLSPLRSDVNRSMHTLKSCLIAVSEVVILIDTDTVLSCLFNTVQMLALKKSIVINNIVTGNTELLQSSTLL